MLTQAELKSQFSYDVEKGLFTRINSFKGSGAKIGAIVGTINNRGYVVINYKQKIYAAHRLVWLYIYGEIPELIDHINCIRHDNRLCNLRTGNHSLNMQNIKKLKSNNTSGYLGVCKCKKTKKWVAKININNNRIYIGRYETAELASKAYLEYKKIHHEFYVE